MNCKLSVVIITFNEEKNIERCLKSVKDIADEIIVVDSFSKDATKSICEKYKVKFYEQKWLGYAQQKNFANSLANNNYILSIDADEVISETLKKSILSISKFKGVYKFNRLTNYCGKPIKHCGWYPDKKIRIFPKDQVKWQGEFIHETLTIPDDLEVNYLKGDMLHYTFHTVGEHINTMNNFSEKEALERLKREKRTNFMKIIFKSHFKFFIMYFIKLGFLDGYYGFIVCKNSAYASFLREVKLCELSKNQ